MLASIRWCSAMSKAGLAKAGAAWLATSRSISAGSRSQKRPRREAGSECRGFASVACPATAIKRQFLLQVHPDMLMSYPKERAINGENLKVLNNFLDRDAAASRSHSLFGGRGSASPRDLVFYLKPQPSSCPSRVTVPLDDTVLHRLSGILQEHCNLELQPPLHSNRPETRSPSPEEGRGGWGHQHAQNEWARQYNSHQQGSWGHGQQHQQQQQQEGWDYTRTRRRSDPPRSPLSLDTFLAGVAQAEARDATLARRRDAAAQLKELGASLAGEWGFESVDVRCEWAAEYLAVSLATLHAALLAHEDALHLRRGEFKGMDIVLSQHDIVWDEDVDVGEGRVLLCPSDTPTRWIETLMRVRPRDVARACELRHESALLTRAFQQSVVPGCVLERGLTCSHGELRALLRRTVSGLAWGLGMGGGPTESGLSRPWEQLRVRVEHNHRSRVLETGGLQLDSRTEYDDLRTLLGRLGPRALQAQHEEMEQDLLLRELVGSATAGPLQLLSVHKDPSLSSLQAVSCLSRLLATGHSTVGEALRGQALVIGNRGYGLSKEGAVLVPWDWALSTSYQ